MAASGAVLFLFVVAHMLGNLKLFTGRAHFDDYAGFLRNIGSPALGHSWFLWTQRSVLLAAVALHIGAAYQLGRQSRRARPVPRGRAHVLGLATEPPVGSTGSTDMNVAMLVTAVCVILRQTSGVRRHGLRSEIDIRSRDFEAGVLRRSLGWAEKTWGPGHWRVARVRLDLATQHLAQHNPESAEEEARIALAMLEPRDSKPRSDLVDALLTLGAALYEQHRFAEAQEHDERALVIARALHGNHDPLVAACLGQLADLQRLTGDP